MPSVEVDFETYKAIVARRQDETVSEGDVVRAALGLNLASGHSTPMAAREVWWHKGVELPVGMTLEHTFRDGKVVYAEIVHGGIRFAGSDYRTLSAAGVAAAGYQVDGWAFWGFRDERGNLATMKAMRH